MTRCRFKISQTSKQIFNKRFEILGKYTKINGQPSKTEKMKIPIIVLRRKNNRIEHIRYIRVIMNTY